MSDFSPIHSHFKSNNLPCFTIYPKSKKPIKVLIWHLPVSTPADDISDGLVNLGFDVISVKQMHVHTTCQSHAEGTISKYSPLPNKLTYNVKVHEIFKLMSLCHVTIRTGAYKAQTGLTQ
jgi:Co/Zn/Cd efflux system component